jgi:hypothetical protein
LDTSSFLYFGSERDSRPLNLCQNTTKAGCLLGIDHFQERYLALQVGPELGVAGAILTYRTVPNTVRYGGLDAIEIGPGDVGVAIHNQPGQVLSRTTAHDPRFAMVYRKALLNENGGRVGGEALHARVEVLRAGESKIVGVSCISGSGGTGEPGEAAIGPDTFRY